jgi:hypothetical protein
VILVEVLVPGGFGRAVAAPIGARVTVIDLKAVAPERVGRSCCPYVHNRPDASFE